MQIRTHKSEWWYDAKLPRIRTRISSTLRNADPVHSGLELPKQTRVKTGRFDPKRKWVAYNRLQPLEAGYVVPLYTLKDIALRYGLSLAGRRYFRNHILPEPFDIMRRRSVSAHHWSRIVLSVLDLVLADLEQKGSLQFLNTYDDHLDLLHIGIEHLTDHYKAKSVDQEATTADKLGVEWYD